jgi:hypothetical protein
MEANRTLSTPTRRDFIIKSGILAASAAAGLSGGAHGADVPVVRLKTWEMIEIPHRKEHFRPHVKITGDNGTVGYRLISRKLASELRRPGKLKR